MPFLNLYVKLTLVPQGKLKYKCSRVTATELAVVSICALWRMLCLSRSISLCGLL